MSKTFTGLGYCCSKDGVPFHLDTTQSLLVFDRKKCKHYL